MAETQANSQGASYTADAESRGLRDPIVEQG